MRAYNVLGREVALLAHGWQPAGVHTMEAEGRGLGRAMYLARATIQTAAGVTAHTANVVVVH